MAEELRHECGVAAVYDLRTPEPGASKDLLAGPAEEPKGAGNGVEPAFHPFALIGRMLMDMQTRGQLAAGISSYDPERKERLRTRRKVGSVTGAFALGNPGKYMALSKRFSGSAAIGHTRYATTGLDDIRYSQPFERRHARLWKWFSFAFNGTLTNFRSLRGDLHKRKGYHFTLDTDTEVIEHYLAYALRGERRPDAVKVMQALAADFDGAYCLIFLDAAGRLFAARDPSGFRPLSWSVKDGIFAAASESVALSNLGHDEIHSVAPGEMLIIENGIVSKKRFAEPRKPSRCFFEWIYFSNVASVIDDIGVYETRARGGRALAEREEVPIDENTIAVPVPDTAKAAADAFAFALKIPCVEGIIRNRYVGRTFIQSAGMRQGAAKSKYTALPSVLSGKKVFLVEDSIVRSTTLKSLIGHIRSRCRPLEIHVRIACPPIVSPCFYGIDLSTLEELFASDLLVDGFSRNLGIEQLDRMAKILQVDSLRYLPVEELVDSLGGDRDSYCLGCVTRTYPTPAGEAAYQRALKRKEEGATPQGSIVRS